RSYYPAGEARHAAASLHAAYEDRRPKLKTIKVPTVVVHGEDDPIIAVEAGRDVAENIPGAEFRLMPGLGHVIPPALVNDIADAITAAASRATGTQPTKGLIRARTRGGSPAVAANCGHEMRRYHGEICGRSAASPVAEGD